MANHAAEWERRDCGECRVDLQEGRKIRGVAIAFNKPSVNLGGFREIILPEAVDRTFREGIDVRALVDHDSAKIIGRLKAGTLRLQKKSSGLFNEIDPPNTSVARDLLESIDRGDISGQSFAFQVLEDDWQEDDNGMPLRLVSDMRISEVSVVTFPAYESTSVDVAKRSLQHYMSGRKPKSTDWRRQYAEIHAITKGLR